MNYYAALCIPACLGHRTGMISELLPIQGWVLWSLQMKSVIESLHGLLRDRIMSRGWSLFLLLANRISRITWIYLSTGGRVYLEAWCEMYTGIWSHAVLLCVLHMTKYSFLEGRWIIYRFLGPIHEIDNLPWSSGVLLCRVPFYVLESVDFTRRPLQGRILDFLLHYLYCLQY